MFFRCSLPQSAGSCERSAIGGTGIGDSDASMSDVVGIASEAGGRASITFGGFIEDADKYRFNPFKACIQALQAFTESDDLFNRPVLSDLFKTVQRFAQA